MKPVWREALVIISTCALLIGLFFVLVGNWDAGTLIVALAAMLRASATEP